MKLLFFQTHGESGLTASVRASTKDMTACEDELLVFVRKHVPEGKCPLAGNSVGQDAKFLERCMPRLMKHLHYRLGVMSRDTPRNNINILSLKNR